MRHFNAEILGRFGLVLGPSAVTGIVFERPRTRDRDGVTFFLLVELFLVSVLLFQALLCFGFVGSLEQLST